MAKAKHKPKSSLVFMLRLLLVLCLFLGCGWMSIGFTYNPNPIAPSQELETARHRWTSQNIDDYQMVVSFFAPFDFIGQFLIQIEDNEVIAVSSRPYESVAFRSLPNSSDWLLNGYEGIFPHNLSDYTIDQLFEFIAQNLVNEPIPPVIAWCGIVDDDPLNFHYYAYFNHTDGYIERISYSNCVRWDIGGGFMCPIISDCAVSLQTSDFQTLTIDHR